MTSLILLLCKYSLTPIIRNLRWNKSAKKMLLSLYRLTWLVCFPPITLFTLFTNYGISESKWMFYNIILFDGAYFLLAVMVVGDKSSWWKMANKLAVLAGYWPYWQRCTSVEGTSWLGPARPVVCLLSVQIPTIQAPLQGLCTSSVGEALIWGWALINFFCL